MERAIQINLEVGVPLIDQIWLSRLYRKLKIRKKVIVYEKYPKVTHRARDRRVEKEAAIGIY